MSGKKLKASKRDDAASDIKASLASIVGQFTDLAHKNAANRAIVTGLLHVVGGTGEHSDKLMTATLSAALEQISQMGLDPQNRSAIEAEARAVIDSIRSTSLAAAPTHSFKVN
jgi:hypothetical protein